MAVLESQPLHVFGSMTARSRQDMNTIGRQLTDETLFPACGWALNREVTMPRSETILGTPSTIRILGPHIRRKRG